MKRSRFAKQFNGEPEAVALPETLELLSGERCLGESIKAMIACNDYLRMGPARSQAGLLRRYKRMTHDN